MSGLSDNIDVFIQKHLDSIWSLELTPDDVRLEVIADRFGMSKRTLQRRLGEKNMSYASILDESRRRKVSKIIDSSDVCAADIATMLGFTDTTGFHHAFKRWFGLSLRQLRQKNKLAKASKPKKDRFFVGSL